MIIAVAFNFPLVAIIAVIMMFLGIMLDQLWLGTLGISILLGALLLSAI